MMTGDATASRPPCSARRWGRPLGTASAGAVASSSWRGLAGSGRARNRRAWQGGAGWRDAANCGGGPPVLGPSQAGLHRMQRKAQRAPDDTRA